MSRKLPDFWDFVRYEIHNHNSRYHVVVAIYKTTQKKYNSDGSVEEIPIEITIPVHLRLKDKGKYKPHQGNREKDRRIRYREHNLSKGKPVQ